MNKFMKKARRVFLAAIAVCAIVLPQNIAFASSPDGTAGVTMNGTTVTGYTGTGGNVVIPENATSIAAGAFSGFSNINAISIPSSVTSIGDNAFSNCTGLSSITIPGGVSSLGTGVLSGCSRLSSVSMQASVGSIPSRTFSGCTSLTSIAISSSINSIGDNAFSDCKSLSSMAVPSGVTNIGSGAFSGCSSLQGVSIPASTTNIATDAFSGCSALTTINVAGGNGTYASDGGCLYNGSYTKLLLCPPAKSSIALNSAVKIIAGGAFNGCSRITSITIPDNATTIEPGAFSNSGVTSITIPKKVTSIGSQSWNPDIIYGYTDSVAESYARDNDYVFYALDGNAGGDEDDDTTEITTGNANYEDLDGEDVEDDDDDDFEPEIIEKNDSNTGSNKKPATKPTKTTTKPSSNKNSSGAYASTTSNVHQADDTPKTGDGFNPKFMICIALVLIGCAFFLLGKKKSA